MSSPLKVLLFDLGGVVIEIDFNHTFDIWSTYSGVASDELRSRFSIDLAYRKHERGEIVAREYFRSLRDSLQVDLSDSQFEEGWMAMLGSEVEGIESLLFQLKDQFALYLFSNSNKIHHSYWTQRYDRVLQMFQTIFVSSEIGVRKPDTDAFLAVANAIGESPGNILFFDDTRENVEGARNAGFDSVQVNSVDAIRNALMKKNILL
ncbi:MAG: HAD-IA family hydrolase [Methylococcales bacterium]